jgi:hypothetical protein
MGGKATRLTVVKAAVGKLRDRLRINDAASPDNKYIRKKAEK